MLLKKLAVILTVASIGATIFTSNKEVMATDSYSKAKEIVSNMTLEEKLGQMIMPDFRIWQEEGAKEPSDLTEINSEVAEVIDKYDLGGVILFLLKMLRRYLRQLL